MLIVIHILLFILLPVLVICNKHKAVFFISILSLFLDYFLSIGSVGFRVPAFVFLIYFFISPKYIIIQCRGFTRFLWIELLVISITGILFGFFFPWNDPYEYSRTITQKLPLRTIIGIVRTIEVFFCIYYCFYIIKKRHITIITLINTVFYITIISLVMGLFDLYFTNGAIRLLLRPEHLATMRFTGLASEPRHIAQTSTIFFLFSLPLLNDVEGSYRIKIKTICLCCVSMVALSFSSTGLVYMTICLIIYAFIARVKFKYIIGSIIVGFMILTVLLSSEYFVEHQTARLAQVTLENGDSKIEDIPDWINSFEVFDQAALAFYYFNPQHLFFGVGPNTIGIPSSDYMSRSSISVLGDSINTSPFNGVIYTLSRSGILGVMLYFFVFKSQYKRLRRMNKSYAHIFLLAVVYFALYRSDIFFMVYGMIISLANVKEQTDNLVSKV
jgi:hypothetical protein